MTAEYTDFHVAAKKASPVCIVVSPFTSVCQFLIEADKQANRTDRLRQTLRRSVVSTVLTFLCIISTDFLSSCNQEENQSLDETKQATNSTTVAKETIPAIKSKSAPMKSVTDAEAVETKSETEDKTLAETKPEGKPMPAAVPVVTAEEAETLNAEVLDYIKSLERKKDVNILEGKIVAMSECPDPASIDYPDCNLVLTVSLNNIAHTKINLIVPCIRDSKIIIRPDIKPDSLIAFKLADEDSLPEGDKGIQISDDDPNFDLDYCYVEQIETIAVYSKISNYTGQQADEIKYDSKLALTDKDVQTRKEFIDSELVRINKIISDYSEEDAKVFYDRFIELTSDMGEKNHPYAEITCEDDFKKILPLEVNVPPKDFINHAFTVKSNTLYHNATVIASINRYLKERGILLIVIPFPQHFESYANRFNLSKQLSTYNICRVRYIKFLLEMDVEVLDIEPLIEKDLYSHFYIYQVLKKDLHPTEMGAYLLSQRIADHLNSYEFFQSVRKNNYSLKTEKAYDTAKYYEHEIKGVETLVPDKKTNPISKESPILLVGDSFSMSGEIQYFLANSLQTKINVINETSSYPKTARLLQMRKQEISSNTKVCLLLNTSYELYRECLPLLKNEIILFPNASLFPDQDLHFEKKDQKNELVCEFDLDISSLVVNNNRYTLYFYLSSEISYQYEIQINSSEVKTMRSHRTDSGFECDIEYPLDVSQHPLHVTITTRHVVDARNNLPLVLNVKKIVLTEE